MRFFTVTLQVAIAESHAEPLRSFGSASAMLGNIVAAVTATEGVFFSGITVEDNTLEDDEATVARQVGETIRRMVATPMGPIPAPTLEELEAGALESTGKTAEQRASDAIELNAAGEIVALRLGEQPPVLTLGGGAP